MSKLTEDQRPLKMNELKQAISVLFEIEGDSLLIDEQGSLHSDKDIELICGSLLVVRKETLQVIHLTVKEFLSAIDGPRNSAHAELLIDPEKANMALSHMCLKYIATDCVYPITDVKDDISRINIQNLPSITESIRNERPLAEYTMSSWLAHLTDCEKTQIQEIGRIFWQAFGSKVTFNWCELCMALQPDSADRLLIGLDELSGWILDSKPHHWFEQNAGCRFSEAWCSKILDLSLVNGLGKSIS